MRPSLSLKTLLRTPFKTIMTFLLIALASFALFSRIADFSVTAREMKKVEDSYHGVIAIDNGVPIVSQYQQWHSHLPKTVSYKPSIQPKIKPITSEQIEAFSNLSSVTIEKRYMTGGVIEELQRLNQTISAEYDWGYDYGARFIIEGTFEGYTERPFIFNGRGYILNFSDIKQLAGRRQYEDGETIPILAGNMLDASRTLDTGSYYYPIRITFGDEVVVDKTFTPDSNTNFLFENDPYRQEFVESLVPGTRYLFIGRYIPNTFDKENYEEAARKIISSGTDFFKKHLSEEAFNTLVSGEYKIIPIEDIITFWIEDFSELDTAGAVESVANMKEDNVSVAGMAELFSGNPMMRVGDYDTYDFCPSFIELTDTEDLAKAQELVEITNQDLHTFDIVYTEDMAAIPRFNEREMVITNGRAITADDSEICVISEYLAKAYNLKLGDKLNIGLGDKLFEQYAQMGAIEYIPERRFNIAKKTDLEIIGIYKDIDAMESRNADMYMGYSPNTIFVPLSQLPIEIPADHEMKSGEFSVFIENPANFEAVLTQAEPIATEIGVKLRASDGGYANIRDSINESMKTSTITMCLYVFAAALALVLSIYLYIGRNTKTYAIMRALGTTVNQSRNSLILPFGLLCIAGILLGGIVGLVYTQNEMKTVLKSFEVLGSSYTVDASIPVMSVLFAFICEVLFIAGFTALFLHRLAITSPLTLLQGDSSKKAKPKKRNKAKKPNVESTATSVPFEVRAFVLSPLPEKRNYSAFHQSFSYISRHMLRTKWKTMIALVLSFALAEAIGVITLTKSNYEEMFKQVEVNTSINNFNQTSILKLSDSGLIREIYYYIDRPFVVNDDASPVDLKVTNDVNRYFYDTFKSEPPIRYSDGYSSEIFDVDFHSESDEAVCIIGNQVASDYGIKLGDNISLLDYDIFEANSKLIDNEDYIKMCAVGFAGQYETYEELRELVNQDCYNAMAVNTKIWLFPKVSGFNLFPILT
jgi:hypothetical protein